jgi:hypothetical protein
MKTSIHSRIVNQIQEATQGKTLNDAISRRYDERRALSPFEGRRAKSLRWENSASFARVRIWNPMSLLVRGHRPEIMFGVLVVVLGRDPIARLDFGLGQRQVPVIVSSRVVRAP